MQTNRLTEGSSDVQNIFPEEHIATMHKCKNSLRECGNDRMTTVLIESSLQMIPGNRVIDRIDNDRSMMQSLARMLHHEWNKLSKTGAYFNELIVQINRREVDVIDVICHIATRRYCKETFTKREMVRHRLVGSRFYSGIQSKE